MTTKERLHQLIDALPDYVSLSAERCLEALRATDARVNGAGAKTQGELTQALQDLQDYALTLPRPARPLTEGDCDRESIYEGRI